MFSNKLLRTRTTPPTVSACGSRSRHPAAASVLVLDIAQVAMVAPGSALLGVANGADPLLVVVPEFDARKIGQSNPAGRRIKHHHGHDPEQCQLGAGDGQLRGDNIGAHECAGCG